MATRKPSTKAAAKASTASPFAGLTGTALTEEDRSILRNILDAPLLAEADQLESEINDLKGRLIGVLKRAETQKSRERLADLCNRVWDSEGWKVVKARQAEKSKAVAKAG